MEYEEFEQLVAPRVRTRTQAKRIRDIWDDALMSIGCEAGEVLQFGAKLMVEDLHNIRASIKAVDEQIAKICTEFPEYHHLLTIPGFGPDIIKLVGYDLSASRTGKTSDRAIPRISKRGNAHLRYTLYQAAFVASTSNKYFKRYYANQLLGREREKGINTKMKVKLAAKMLIIAWTLMKKKESFDPTYLNIE